MLSRETPRLLLRPPTVEDLEPFVEIHEDPEVMRYMTVIGPLSGAFSCVVSCSPNMEVTSTLLLSTGRPQKRSGMSAAVFRIVAARSSVRLLQLASFAQSRA